ncbi:MAG: hypothetical protein HFI37_06810 [Lachnospiraceae bacterium]|nr:hypothetical protein [Lachnospiraceae bacterium]
MKNYILVIDEGTTGVRALLFDRAMKIVASEYQNLQLYYPGPEQVEMDAKEVFNATVAVCRKVVGNHGISAEEIECVGTTYQRATWLFWDKTTGEPLRNAVTWQDGRGIHHKQKLVEDKDFDKKFPGLAPYLPGNWIMMNLYGVEEDEPEFKKAIAGENVLFGCMESYIGWRLTNGAVHATTRSSAGSTGVYVAAEDRWNTEALEFFGVRKEILPELREESGEFGMMSADILGIELPIYSSFADQQSAMFAQNCHKADTGKCTLGTGAFMDFNIGDVFGEVPGTYTAITWQINGKKNYLVEGLSNTAGACLEWAKDQFKLFEKFEDMEEMATSVEDNGGVYFIPALAGIMDDSSAKGAYLGIRPHVTNQHMMRATLEGVAFGALLLMETIAKHGKGLKEISISGGVAKSSLVAQILANVTDAKIVRPKSVEATALGAAEAAAIRAGWMTMEDVKDYLDIDKVYEPDKNAAAYKKTFENWKKAAERTLKWDI